MLSLTDPKPQETLDREDSRRLHFVLNRPIYEMIFDLAQKHERSVCGEVRYILLQYLETTGMQIKQ